MSTDRPADADSASAIQRKANVQQDEIPSDDSSGEGIILRSKENILRIRLSKKRTTFPLLEETQLPRDPRKFSML